MDRRRIVRGNRNLWSWPPSTVCVALSWRCTNENRKSFRFISWIFIASLSLGCNVLHHVLRWVLCSVLSGFVNGFVVVLCSCFCGFLFFQQFQLRSCPVPPVAMQFVLCPLGEGTKWTVKKWRMILSLLLVIHTIDARISFPLLLCLFSNSFHYQIRRPLYCRSQFNSRSIYRYHPLRRSDISGFWMIYAFLFVSLLLFCVRLPTAKFMAYIYINVYIDRCRQQSADEWIRKYK